MPHPVTFAAATAVTRVGEGRFDADVRDTWTIGGKPNGGYLLATIGRAACAVSPHPHPIAASAHYLRSPDPGPASIEVEVLRSGRTASQLRARLWQGDRVCIETLLTTSTLTPDAAPYWSNGVLSPGTEPQADCVRIPGVNPMGVPVPLMDQIDLRIEPATLGFASGTPSGRGELRGWLALPADEPFDPVSLLFGVDAFPPATFDIELTGWVPTLELTVYVRALPAPGPLRVVQRANLVADQRVDETCWLWDSTGALVAQCTQLAGIRLG